MCLQPKDIEPPQGGIETQALPRMRCPARRYPDQQQVTTMDYVDRRGRRIGRREWAGLQPDPLYRLVAGFEDLADPANWTVVTVWDGLAGAAFTTWVNAGGRRTVFACTASEQQALAAHRHAVTALRAVRQVHRDKHCQQGRAAASPAPAVA